MPEALSSHPSPYRHHWQPGDNYNDIYTGWSLSAGGLRQVGRAHLSAGRHVVEKYGRDEVEQLVLRGLERAGHRLLAGLARGLSEALRLRRRWAEARGADGAASADRTSPARTGRGPSRCSATLSSIACAGPTSRPGRSDRRSTTSRFHAKGAPRVVDGHVRMGVSNQLRAIANGFEIVASFPELKRDADHHRRIGSRGMRGVLGPTNPRTRIATARCIRATRPSRLRAPTSSPTCTRSTCAAR